MSAVSKEVNEKFRKAADNKKEASSALPHWGDIYCLGDLDDFYKAPKINENFPHMLSKGFTTRYVSLSLEDSAKL